jgi:hypothetical protein
VQPAGRLGHEEQVTAADLAAVDHAAQQGLVGHDRAVGQRDDRLVDRPELGLGEHPDLDGDPAAGQLDGERRGGQQPGGQRRPLGRRIGDHPHGLGLGTGELAGQPLEQPVQPTTPAGIDDIEHRRSRMDREAQSARGPGDRREHVPDGGGQQRARRAAGDLPVPAAAAHRAADGSHDRRMTHPDAGSAKARPCPRARAGDTTQLSRTGTLPFLT